MSLPAVQLAEPADDDATEMTHTDVLSTAVVLLEEAEDGQDDPTALDGPDEPAPFLGMHLPASAVQPLTIGDEVSDRDPLPHDSATQGSALELRVLRSELLRLRRDIDTLRDEREATLQEVLVTATEAREAHAEAADWRHVAQRAEDQVRLLERERDHYRRFAQAGLWARIRGCPDRKV